MGCCYASGIVQGFKCDVDSYKSWFDNELLHIAHGRQGWRVDGYATKRGNAVGSQAKNVKSR
jgi:hypothetical protein